jgi:hypothetical protein
VALDPLHRAGRVGVAGIPDACRVLVVAHQHLADVGEHVEAQLPELGLERGEFEERRDLLVNGEPVLRADRGGLDFEVVEPRAGGQTRERVPRSAPESSRVRGIAATSLEWSIMSVEVRPLGVKCNIQSQYCYQNPQRDAGNIPNEFDVPKMKAALDRAGSNFTIFGGEPLLVPEPVLEELLAFGKERFGTNGIQTNGTLINDRFIELFKKYSVQVGISVDGPEELNDVR